MKFCAAKDKWHIKLVLLFDIYSSLIEKCLWCVLQDVLSFNLFKWGFLLHTEKLLGWQRNYCKGFAGFSLGDEDIVETFVFTLQNQCLTDDSL